MTHTPEPPSLKVLCLIHKPTGQKFALLKWDNYYGCDAVGRDKLSDFISNTASFHGKLNVEDFALKVMKKGTMGF